MKDRVGFLYALAMVCLAPVVTRKKNLNWWKVSSCSVGPIWGPGNGASEKGGQFAEAFDPNGTHHQVGPPNVVACVR